VAHHSLTGRPIDLELAGEVLDHMYPVNPSPRLTVEKIQQRVASHAGISPDDLVSSSRTARVAWPRQVAMYLARELTKASLNDVGAAFGGRNHATILHACKRVAERLTTDPEVAADLADLTASITGRQGDRSC
jgi:chromosomal replication initiator protein